MKLERKKDLIARTLNIGKDRIILNTNRLSEIKEAITKQDIRDLFASGAIFIKEIKGTRTNVPRNLRRRAGSIKKKVLDTKREYINRTRRFRDYVQRLKNNEMISKEVYQKIRQEIRASMFKTLSHLKERIEVMKHA